MRLELTLLREEEQAEGADVQRSTMVLGWEVRVVPSFHGCLSELDEFDGFKTGCRHEVAKLVLVHPVMLVVRQELLLFFLSLLLLLSALKIFVEVIDQLIIDSNHVLFDPSVHRPLLLQVVNVVLNGLSSSHMRNNSNFFRQILRGLHNRSLLICSVLSLLRLLYTISRH